MQNKSENKKSSFFYAFALLPKAKREAMNDFYSFAHICDEIADNPEKSIPDKINEFAEWKEQFELGLAGKSHCSLLNRIGNIVNTYNLSTDHFYELFSGMEFDLNQSKIVTINDLENYSYKVASTIGLITIEIFGYKNEKEKIFAVNLGKALQITNIMRDVKKDYMNSRIYIPQELFDKFGYSEKELADFTFNDSFRNLMKFLGSKSHYFFDEAFKHFDKKDYRTLYPAIAMGKIYYELLTVIESNNYNVFKEEFALSKKKKIALVVREIIRGKIGL